MSHHRNPVGDASKVEEKAREHHRREEASDHGVLERQKLPLRRGREKETEEHGEELIEEKRREKPSDRSVHRNVEGDESHAEREKRAVILKADGEKQAAITAAEGEKESAILRADAVKQQRILEAEGEAQAILAVQKANADAIRLLNEAMPSDKVLAIRSLEALAKVANGKATKIIIPSELQNLGGVVPSIKELMTDPKDAE